MRLHLRKLGAALAVAALLATPVTASAGELQNLESSNSHPAFDALVMRPLGFVGLVASAALWVPVEAVTLAVRPSEWEKPIDLMLRKPYEFVFVHPLGSH